MKALFVLAGNRFSDWRGDFELMKRVDLLVIFELLPSPLHPLATATIPAAAWTETDGTMTNMQGRIQRFWRGVDPAGDAIPQWQALVELGQRFGLQGYQQLKRAEDAFKLLAASTPGYAGLDYSKIGDRGVLRVVEEAALAR